MTNVWIVNAFVIELIAVAGVVGVALTNRTKAGFAAGFNTMLVVTVVYVIGSPPFNARHAVILAMVGGYLLHMNWLLFSRAQHTAVPKLDTKLKPREKYVLPFLLANGVGWGYCLPLYFAARRSAPLGMLDIAAIGVYAVGSVFHLGGDYQKTRFKSRPESVGRLLDSGFWALSRHPNYFGDLLIYVAFAIIGGDIRGWVAPVLNFLQYRFDAIPKNEQWAAQRYGKAWEEYARRTKMLIPFLY